MKTLAFCLLLLLSEHVNAIPVVASDFEAFTNGENITSQIPFAAFSNATVLTAGESLNEFDFPPNSGVNAVVDVQPGISIHFDATVNSFSAYITYAVPVKISFIDFMSNEVGFIQSQFANNTLLSGDLNSRPNEKFSFNDATGFTLIRIEGSPLGNSFILDDLLFEVSAVPEPAIVWLLPMGVIIFGLSRWRLTQRSKLFLLSGIRRILFLIVSSISFCVTQALAQQVPISAPLLSPASTGVNQPVLVTVTAKVGPGGGLIPASVTLLRYDAQGKFIENLGRMYDDGTHGDQIERDSIFTIQINVANSAQNVQQFRVSVASRNYPTRTLSALAQFIVESTKTAEQTIGEVASQLTAGDVEAALKSFSGSPKNRAALTRLSGEKLAELAIALSQAQLVRELGTLREYSIPVRDNGTLVHVNITMAKTSSGLWQIVSW